jgi:CheY-like chemotaxis protein
VALYIQNREEIKVVLMDMRMPIMDGPMTIRALLRIDPQVKIISVSGLKGKDNLTEVTGAHVQAFLPKPYTAEVLLKTIHEVLSVSSKPNNGQQYLF